MASARKVMILGSHFERQIIQIYGISGKQHESDFFIPSIGSFWVVVDGGDFDDVIDE